MIYDIIYAVIRYI